MKSYAAHGVDTWLAERLPEFGYAVDVGASNGVLSSNTLALEERGWFVLCLEPNPRHAMAGRSVRKLWLPYAAGSQCETARPFTLCGNYPWAAFSGFHVDEVPEDRKNKVPATQETIVVDVVTLNQVLRYSGFPRLDLLSLDCEGHELETLRGLDLVTWRPLFIVAESWERESSLLAYVARFGYHLEVRLGEDNVYGLSG